MVDADSPAPEPRNCSNAAPKSDVDSPWRYSSGSTSATRGDLRAHAGRIAEANRFRSPVAGSVRLSLTRGARTRTGRRRDHLAFVVMTVADHQPVTILIDLLGMGVDVGRHLRLQGDREHLPRSLAHDLIEHRTARLVGLGLVVDYFEHGRTFPTGAPTPAHDQTCLLWAIDLPREGAPLHVTPPRTIHRF